MPVNENFPDLSVTEILASEESFAFINEMVAVATGAFFVSVTLPDILVSADWAKPLIINVSTIKTVIIFFIP